MSAFIPCPALPRGLDGRRFRLLPLGIVSGAAAAASVAAGTAWPIADGPLAFTAAGIAWREEGGARLAVAGFAEALEWAEAEAPEILATIHRTGARRAPWAGLALDRPLVMGIVNATPDSFSDGGETPDAATAVARGLAMIEAGADIVDVGGESTRPGAQPVSEDEELARVIPVVAALAAQGVPVSIDTRHARVMEQAVAAGARIVNDVTALREPGALEAAARTGAAICLMHMQGEPRTMQARPAYECAPLDILDFLDERVAACEAAGIAKARIAVDPGIGFGKTALHSAQAIAALALLHGLGCAVLMGASRKSFIARLAGIDDPKLRLPGTLAAHQAGLDSGAQILRVHDVAEAVQALALWKAIRAGI